MVDALYSQRRNESVAVRFLKRVKMPGGGLLLPGELATVTEGEATQLYAQGLAEAATPKSLDAAPRDTMQHRPTMKKGTA
jgi:hypothetical protein